MQGSIWWRRYILASHAYKKTCLKKPVGKWTEWLPVHQLLLVCMPHPFLVTNWWLTQTTNLYYTNIIFTWRFEIPNLRYLHQSPQRVQQLHYGHSTCAAISTERASHAPSWKLWAWAPWPLHLASMLKPMTNHITDGQPTESFYSSKHKRYT